MKRFKATSSDQIFLLPPTLDELVPQDALARIISEVVEQLELRLLYKRYDDDGRPAYHPKMMLKVLFYAYSTGITSSRKIAQRLEQDVHFMFLSGMETPNFRTINDFRKNNLDLLHEFFKQIVLYCVHLGMVSVGHIAIDGSKIKASASKKQTKNAAQLEKEIQKIEQEISALLQEAEQIDRSEDKCFGKNKRGDELPKKIQSKQARKKKLEHAKEQLEQQKLTKINVTDPDSHFMKTPTHLEVCYNGQLAVDSDFQVIVANDVTTDVVDSQQLIPLYEQSVANVDNTAPSEISADCGYANHTNYAYIQDNQIDAYLPPNRDRLKSDTVTDSDPRKRYDKEHFTYIADRDIFLCPENRELHFFQNKKHRGHALRVYRSLDCGGCPALSVCLDKANKSQLRRIHRYATDDFITEMRKKLLTKTGKQAYDQRKITVEPVFGNLKFNLGFKNFSLRGHKKVRGEFDLMCIAHDLRKIYSFIKNTDNKLALA